MNVNRELKTRENAHRMLMGVAFVCGIGFSLPIVAVPNAKQMQQSLQTSSKTLIKGTVYSADDGEPVIGASVMVQGEKTGVITNVDGEFTISVPAGKRIVVSYIGMQSMTLTPKQGMKVELHSDAKTLSDVVVTGMQKVDKRLFTGSTTKVDATKTKLDGVADVSRSLEGRAAGVSVQNVSGTFGTAPKIRVRGATSIYGNSKPLWVVDGVIMEDVVDVSADDLSSGDPNTLISSAIAGLNADDIESFQILKDGSATSIYGARAMGGVIVITTKKGKSGSAHISYTGEYTMRLKPSYSTFNIMNSQDQMGVYQELQQKGFLNYAESAVASTSGVYGKMYQLMSQYNPATGKFALDNTDEAIASYLRAAEYRNTNWFDLLFSNAVMHNHSISVSGGTDNAQYYASVSAMFDPGWTLQSRVKRYTINLNSTFKLSNHLELNVIGNGSYRDQRAPGTVESELSASDGKISRDFDINPYSYALNTSRALDPNEYYTRSYAPFNIIHELNNNYMDLNVSDFRLQARLNYNPIRKVELSVLGAVKYSTTSREHKILDNSNQALAYRAMGTSTIRSRNRLLYTDPANPYALPQSVLENGGIYERSDNKLVGWDFRATASYNDVYKDDHIVNLYAGLEANSADRHSTWFRGWGMQYSMGEVANYGYQVFKKSLEDGETYYWISNRHNRTAAFFGTASYSWKGRYNVNGTIRYEGSNQLGKSRQARWLPTWNTSASWNIHEEPFFKRVEKVLSFAKLRASYSLTAEAPPSSYTSAEVRIRSYVPWKPSAGLRETALYISRLANQELTYEKKHEFNIGFDLGFLKNRINFALDWYKRNNYDLVGQITTQGLGGETTKYGNIASMKSSGVEISLTTNNIKTKKFSWITNFIYSHISNEITDLSTTKRVIDYISGNGFAKVGYPVRSLFSIPFVGLNSEGLPLIINQRGERTVADINFQARSPELQKFLVYEGSIDPTDVGSLGNVFTYKGFTLNVFITYSFGNVVRLDPVFDDEYTEMQAMPKEFYNRWVNPGDQAWTNIPTIASSRQIENYRNNSQYLSYAYNAYNYSTARIAKGDFIRMKEVSLAYDLPKSWTRFAHLNKASLKLQATNLFLIYADKKLNGQDPEFFNTGGVAMPMAKQFTLTLRLGM